MFALKRGRWGWLWRCGSGFLGLLGRFVLSASGLLRHV
jgi:hypothetical protein